MGMLQDLLGGIGDSANKALRSKVVSTWLSELDEAGKRERDFIKEGRRCVEIYEAEASEPTAYNILYANTETLSPALYNSVPRARVRGRFKGKVNPMTVFSAKVLERVLGFLIDANQPQYTSFDDLQKGAVLEALVPGRGCTRFKYDPTITQVQPEATELMPEPEAEDRVDYETICGEEVPWNRVRFGYAKVWNQVPWVAFEHFWTREECIENFGEEIGSSISLTAVPVDSSDKEEKLPVDAEGVKFAHVWEIWDKLKKEVTFISEGAALPIKTVPDPLRLEGFFPMPKPVCFFSKVSSLVPKPLFLQYENQAKELNTVTLRINALTKAMKVRGFYDGTLSGLDLLMQKEDNTLLPTTNVAALQQGQTLDKSIWLMPIEKLITVVQQLYINRQQCKTVIYEITGIADIMRGSSQASETLGAQEIKQAWGTLRLKRMQKEVMRYSVDCLRIMAELAANNFSGETFAAMTGIELPTKEQKEQAQMFMQQQQQAAQLAQQQGQQPQPPDPALMQKAQEALTLPTWDEVIQFLRNDLLRNFSIDIETNSTIDAEATEDKAEVSEFMNAMGQLMNSLTPLIQEGIMPFDAAKSLMLAVIQRFRFGQEVEDEIKKMQAPQPKADPAAEKVKAEMERDKAAFDLEMQGKQADQAAAQAEQRMKQQEQQAAAAASQQEAADKLALAKEELQLARERLAMEREKLGMELDFAREEQKMKLEMLAAQVVAAKAKPATSSKAE